MKLYLINKNPIISKLVSLSAAKLNLEMVESSEIDNSIYADVVLVDDECFEGGGFAAYQVEHPEAKTILLHSKIAQQVEGFSRYIQKPFLPTDLVKILSETLGIEEAVMKDNFTKIDENLNALDAGLDFSKRASKDNPNNQEVEGESGNLQVLDRNEVETIKSLLDDTETKEPILEPSTDALEEQNKHLDEPKTVEEHQEDFVLEDNQSLHLDSIEPKSIGDADISLESEAIEETPQEEKEEVSHDESRAENVDLQVQSEPLDNLVTEPNENITGSSEDIFSGLSFEKMGEALGESIQKDPLPRAIAAKDDTPSTQEMQPSSNPQSIDSLISALQTLQTQALKDLLSGATINISIQFPRKDEML